MLHVYGAPVASDDAGWIVARLYADAHADAVAAAQIIETGIDRELYAVALTPVPGARSCATSRTAQKDSPNCVERFCTTNHERPATMNATAIARASSNLTRA